MFSYRQGICVFTLAVSGLFAQSTTTSTPTPAPETRTSGMIGIAAGQTARVNALNRGVAAPGTGAVCSAMLTFYDEQGNMLKQSAVTVNPGAAASLDLLSDSDLSLAADQRKEIRATISVPAVVTPAAGTSTAAAPAVCRLIGTVEIFDSLTGRTEAQLGGMHAIPPVVAKAAEER